MKRTGDRRRRSVLIAVRACVLLLGLVPTVPARADAQVSVEAEPSVIAADGTLRLSVIVEGDEAPSAAAPSLAALRDWTIIGGPSVSTQIRFINGETSQRRSFTWVLGPPGPGRHTIPAIEVDIGGRTLRTAPQSVTVEPATGGAPGGGRGSRATGREEGSAPAAADDIIVRAHAEPVNPFVGQQVTLRYDLYARAEVASVPQLQEVPAYPGFWAEEIESPRRVLPRQERIDGRVYRVYTIRKTALFPTASGQQTLPPVTFAVPVRAGSSSAFGGGFLFDPIETLFKRTLPVALDVRPLPEAGRPADFSGAVGRFGLRAAADRRAAAGGEAIALTVTVEGTGNARSLGAPRLDPSPDFTLYEPKVKDEFHPDADDRLSGAKTWEYVVIPRLPGPQKLPVARLTTFDPESASYVSLEGPVLEVDIRNVPDADPSAGTAAAPRDIARLASDIRSIKADVSELHRVRPAPYRTGWFWAGLLGPPLLNLGVVGWRWMRRRARHPGWQKWRAARSAEAALRQAARAASDPAALHAGVARALVSYAAAKTGTQASGLTYDRIAGQLARHGVPDEPATRFLGLLRECDFARFSPAAGQGPAGDSDLVDRARRTVRELEEHLQ